MQIFTSSVRQLQRYRLRNPSIACRTKIHTIAQRRGNFADFLAKALKPVPDKYIMDSALRMWTHLDHDQDCALVATQISLHSEKKLHLVPLYVDFECVLLKCSDSVR